MSDETSGDRSGPPDNGTDDGTDDGTSTLDDGTDDGTSALDDAHEALRDAQARLVEVPVEVVVTNHVMGLYELAAIHLSADPPDLKGAALAIDAVACLVEGLGDRIGDDAPTLRNALANIRLAFVQVKGAVAPGSGSAQAHPADG